MSKARLTLSFIFLSLLTAFIFSGCDKDDTPSLPPEPLLIFESIRFEIEEVPLGPSTTEREFFEVTFRYEDGDQDLGPDIDAEIDFSFDNSLIRDDNDNVIRYQPNAGLPPLSCRNYIKWEFQPDQPADVSHGDTLRFDRYNTAANFYIDILFEENGQFVEFDWFEHFPAFACFSFDGLIRNVNQGTPELVPYTVAPINKVQGSITYQIQFSLFTSLFRDKNVKLRFQVRDNAGNFSNFMETDPVFVTR